MPVPRVSGPRPLHLLCRILAIFGPALAWANSIRIDGSSTVYPLTESIADEYSRLSHGRPPLKLGISGSVGGFRLFCQGLTDISEASRPISAGEMAACRQAGIRYVELPVAYDAITVVIHPRNTWARTMTVGELARLWDPDAEGLVTRWSDLRPDWPDAPIHLYMPGLNSGTYEYFTQAIVGKKASRRDLTSSENDNVLVLGVARDLHALGYFGYAYWLDNRDKLAAVAIDCGCDEAVSPSPDTVLAGRYRPLSRPLFLYVRDTYLQRPELRDFVTFYLNRAGERAADLGFFPLPAAVYQRALERLRAGQFGSVFGGRSWTGFDIEEIINHAPRE